MTATVFVVISMYIKVVGYFNYTSPSRFSDWRNLKLNKDGGRAQIIIINYIVI